MSRNMVKAPMHLALITPVKRSTDRLLSAWPSNVKRTVRLSSAVIVAAEHKE